MAEKSGNRGAVIPSPGPAMIFQEVMLASNYTRMAVIQVPSAVPPMMTAVIPGPFPVVRQNQIITK